MSGKTVFSIISIGATVVGAIASAIGMHYEVKEAVDKAVDKKLNNDDVEKFGEDDIEVIDNDKES